MRSVWLANREAAPEELDIEGIKQGIPPLMPRAGTRHPEGGPAVDAERLSLVWLEEGNGVALLEGECPSR